MKNVRNVNSGDPSPNDRPLQRLKQGRGGGHGSKNQKNRSGRSEDTGSGIQDDEAPIEGKVLTEEEMEAFEAECSANSEKEGGGEDKGEEGCKEADGTFREIWKREEEIARRMDADRLKGNNTSETGSAVQEVDQAEELKMAAVPREGHKEPSEEWSEEDGDEFEDASDGQLKSPPKVLRGEQSAVFDVEEAKEQEAITDILMQDAQGQGTEDKEEVETTTNPRRRARFTEEFDEVNEERRKANQRKPLRKNAVRYDLQLRVPPTDPAQTLDCVERGAFECLEDFERSG